MLTMLAVVWCFTVLVAILEMNLPLRLIVSEAPAAHCGWPLRAVELQRKAPDTRWTVATVLTAGVFANLFVAVLLVAGAYIAIVGMLQLAEIRSIGIATLLSLTGMVATYIAIGISQWAPHIHGNARFLNMIHEYLYVVAHTSIATAWFAFPIVRELRRRTEAVRRTD